MSRNKEKPMHPQAQAPENQVDNGRRSTLKWALWGVGAVAAAEFLYVGVNYLGPVRKAGAETAAIVEAGQVDEFPPGSVTAFPQGKFYLARLEEGGFLALARECTHLGCTVTWDGETKQFVCPCHASRFGIAGDVLSPPATRALDLYDVAVFDGIITVNTVRRTRRDRFDPAQLVKGDAK